MMRLKGFRSCGRAKAAGMALVLLASAGISATAQAPDKWAAAESTFKDNCVLCHGDNLAGTPIGTALKVKDLRSKEVLDKKDDALAHTISTGQGGMPAFGSKLSADQIHDLIQYIRHKAEPTP